MEHDHTSTSVAGIDVGKQALDVAVHGTGEETRFPNTQDGVDALAAWLQARGVGRVGLEASGGYERRARGGLEAAGLAVVVHQPLEVRLFARLKRRRAKNDRLDARVIAAATAATDTCKAAADPALAELAERFTLYEEITDAIARLRTQREHLQAPDLRALMAAHLAATLRLKAALAADLIGRIKAHPALGRRWRLLQSIPGIGPLVAAALVVRMPELGSMQRGQAASLLGVAPFDRDSGARKGQRFIGGGRRRPRRMVYLSALSAKRHDPHLKAFADRLAGAGKAAKCITVAVMRKIIEAANLVLARQTPWQQQPQ